MFSGQPAVPVSERVQTGNGGMNDLHGRLAFRLDATVKVVIGGFTSLRIAPAFKPRLKNNRAIVDQIAGLVEEAGVCFVKHASQLEAIDKRHRTGFLIAAWTRVIRLHLELLPEPAQHK